MGAANLSSAGTESSQTSGRQALAVALLLPGTAGVLQAGVLAQANHSTKRAAEPTGKEPGAHDHPARRGRKNRFPPKSGYTYPLLR